MSFIGEENKGTTYNPGYFLAHEECVRETRTIPETGAMVTTTDDGAKYVKMGTIFPANDGTAEGIVYEDVDVATGSMPGSVVTKGVVYENRLPQAEDSYSSATVPTGGNPAKLGLYERSGSVGSYVYTLTTDATASEGKTYYQYDGKVIPSATKTALTAKGFVFKTEPTVTRPFPVSE